jgi:Flp pilus assembly secretin CpaC
VHVFELDFASAVDIDQTVKGLLSPAGSSWVLEGSSDDNRRTREAVAVVDYPANLTQIADYICQADQPPRQVMIEAHILAVELNDDCRNGIFWEQILGVAGNQGNLGFVSPGVFNVTNPQLGDPGNNSTGFIVIDTPKLSSIVEMLQSTTDAKTLASPRLLVVSGQEANIQIGEKIGYRETTTTQTSSLESVKFLDVGVVLSVTPRITRDGRVLMRVKPEVSTGQLNATTGLPNEETTEVQSDVLLEDGHGMVIGGLIQEKDENTQNKVPWLGDIPYAGVLFQRRQVVKSRTEIIVTLIPHIQPYHPTLAHRNDHDFMRTAEPLTYGPLHRFPRPYEPRMPDTFTNPRTLRQNVASLPRPMTGHRDMVRLPPIESESVECVAVSVGVDVETLPTSAAEPELEIVNPLETRRLPRVFR